MQQAAHPTLRDLATDSYRRGENMLAAGRLDEARQYLELAVKQGLRSGSIFFRLAGIAHRQQQVDASIQFVRQAIGLEKNNAEYHFTLGALFKAKGNWATSEQSYRDAVRLDPRYVDAWIGLGLVLRQRGQIADAEQCHRQAVQLDPDNFIAALNLGNTLLSQNRFEEAAQWYRRAVAKNPQSAEAHNNLGRVLLNLGDNEAGVSFMNALKLNSRYFEAADGLATLFFKLGDFEKAILTFEHASTIRPDSLDARLNLANCYFYAHRYEEALAEYERLSNLYPQLVQARGGAAAVHAALGHNEIARELFEQSMAQFPDDTWVQSHYATFLLRTGDFARAWNYYEARGAGRLRFETQSTHRNLPVARWQGESLAGKTLLITCEQGIGDELMFASVFPEILAEAGHCIIECDRRLAGVFRESFPTATLFELNRKQANHHLVLEKSVASLPAFDYWVPAGTLPKYRRNARELFPAHRGYLAANAQHVEHWRTRLNELGPGLKVGISWRGGTHITNANLRSLTLEQLRPVLATAGVHFINLQYGDVTADLDAIARQGATLHSWPEAIEDYSQTAALVAAVDLVITVCTAIVHLSGALGQRVWVMAPFVPEWRYGCAGTEMIWYPSARLFRQPQAGAWEPVIAGVHAALEQSLTPEHSR